MTWGQGWLPAFTVRDTEGRAPRDWCHPARGLVQGLLLMACPLLACGCASAQMRTRAPLLCKSWPCWVGGWVGGVPWAGLGGLPAWTASTVHLAGGSGATVSSS